MSSTRFQSQLIKEKLEIIAMYIYNAICLAYLNFLKSFVSL